MLRARGHGTTQTQVSRWESGQTPRKHVWADLAAVYGCRVDDLFVRAADEPTGRERAFEEVARMIGADPEGFARWMAGRADG